MKSKFFKKTSSALLAAALAMNLSAVASVPAIAEDASALKFECEDGTFTGTGTVKEDAKASGGKYFYLESNSDTCTVKATVPEAGMYNITIRYQAAYGNKIQNLYVNGVDQGQLSFTSEEWADLDCGSVKLNAGENEIMIKGNWGWTNFDCITVSTAVLPEIKATQTTPVDADAIDEAKSLMSYFAEVYGSHIISGQQEIYKYGPHDLETEFEYLNDLTGHYPAIRGFDYGNFTCPAFGSDDGSTERIIDWVKNKNGIATASWHINVPNDMSSYNIGDRIDWAQTSYNAKDNDFSPKKAYTEGTKEYEYYRQALTTLAAEFKKLEEQGIPVVWRPLHEAEGSGGETGSWFWWGKEGSAVYKELWKYTYKTLTEDFGCHNLIWEWNSYNFETSADWYPGDEYVDIIGYDKYNCTVYLEENNWQPSLVHNDSAISSTFYGIMNRYNGAKMVSMAENDSFSTVENLQSEKAGWLYFCTWYDGGSDNINFLSNPIFNTKEDTIAMYQSEYCLTLDEMPDDLYTRESGPVDPSKTTTKSTVVTTTTVSTTTTAGSTTTTVADPSKEYGKVSKDKTSGNYKITLPEPSEDFFITVELPDEVGYANGGLGVSVELDGDYYWANIKWEASKSGDVAVNVIDNFLNCSLGTEVIEDEAVIEAVKAKLASQTEFEGQIWYAQDSAGTEIKDKSGIAITGAYVKKSDDTTTTTAVTTTEGDENTLVGDANLDGKVTVADAVAILQHIALQDKYGLKGQALINADCYNTGDGVTAKDALSIQKLDAKVITELPEIEK